MISFMPGGHLLHSLKIFRARVRQRVKGGLTGGRILETRGKLTKLIICARKRQRSGVGGRGGGGGEKWVLQLSVHGCGTVDRSCKASSYLESWNEKWLKEERPVCRFQVHKAICFQSIFS